MSVTTLESSPATVGLASAAQALESAGLEHWFFGGWAVDLWVGRLTRPHDDIDVLVRRSDEESVHVALLGAGWRHVPGRRDVVGTTYVRGTSELQLTFVVSNEEGGVVVPVPGRPIVLSEGPMEHVRRMLGELPVRVLTLEMMLASKADPRSDQAGGAKDRSDLAVLRAVAPVEP